VDDIKRQKYKKMIELHLRQLDIIICDLIDELGCNYEVSPEMVNDMYKLAFDKWTFLNKYQFINPSN
jgi:hypothetical protein